MLDALIFSFRRKQLIKTQHSRNHVLGFCVVLLLFWLPPTMAEEECRFTRDSDILNKREEELRTTAKDLLQAFRTDNIQAFLDLVYEESFGAADSKQYTLAELKEQSSTKQGIYCYLFDSNCIPSKLYAPKFKPISFAEVAKRSGAKVHSAEVWASEGLNQPGCVGHVTFSWGAKAGEKLGINFSGFTFTYVRGDWKAVGFDIPVTVRIHPRPREK